MGNKLYVGGLPYSVTEGRLQELFATHGPFLGVVDLGAVIGSIS